jgi:hypothetical protein
MHEAKSGNEEWLLATGAASSLCWFVRLFVRSTDSHSAAVGYFSGVTLDEIELQTVYCKVHETDF